MGVVLRYTSGEYKIVQYVPAGEPSPMLEKGRGAIWGKPMTYPRYIMERVSAPSEVYYADSLKKVTAHMRENRDGKVA